MTGARSVDAALLARWALPMPDEQGGKEERGRVLVVAGSRTVPGAALLAGTAALRAGAGKLQVATARSVAVPLALLLPEAKVLGLGESRTGEIRALDASTRAQARVADALLVGPGMAETGGRAVARQLFEYSIPLVLDAGALGAMRSRSSHLAAIVVTPHLGEMAGLLEVPLNRVLAAPLQIARTFAARHRCVVVLKGATTWIVGRHGEAWIHSGGGPGLGTSGSGDVLAGLIIGLLARGAAPEQAAVWAVWMHGRAGSRLSRRLGKLGFLAREIAAEIPAVMDRS